MPPLSIANQTRREKFLNMILDPFGRRRQETVPERGGWDHLVMKPSDADKGFVTQVKDPRLQWLFEKIRVEQDRLVTLTDIRIMLDEAPYIDGVCNKFILWATVDKPNITYRGGSGTKAKKIVEAFLERVEYFSRRGDYLYNGLFLEMFLKKEVAFEPGVEDAAGPNADSLVKEFIKGQPLGRINDILGPLPSETVFRNSNKQDKFDDASKAFYQVPEPYNDPSIPVEQKLDKDWFHQMFLLHPRWNHRRQKNHRYSRPALKPVRKAYNRTEMSATDAVVQRHLAASRLLVIYLHKNVETGAAPGCTEDEYKNFVDEFLQRHPTGFNRPGTTYITSGENEVDSVGDLNLTLSKPADIFMHFDFMSVGLMLHPILAGFTGGEGGRISGPLLEQLKKNLEIDVASVNAWEDREILLPLIYFELFLHGVFDTEVMISHERPTFESKDVRRKTMMSEMESGVRSRKDYYMREIMPDTGIPWDEYSGDIEEEQERFGQPEPTENINKGQKGSKKDSATVPIGNNGGK